MDVLKCVVGSLVEIQVGHYKIHHQARRTTGRITVRLEHIPHSNDILGSFQRVVVVRIFTQLNSAGPKLLIAFAVPHADASPIIALQDDERSGKRETSNHLLLAAVPPALNKVEHSIHDSAVIDPQGPVF